MMRNLNVVAILIATTAIATPVAAKSDGPPARQIQWMNSLDKATTEAQSTGKPILLYLTADYCVYCKQMDKEAFIDTRAVLLSQLFVPCKLDGEHEGKPLIKKYDVKTYPYEAVIDGGGAILASAPEYMDSDKYTKTLATDYPDVLRLRLMGQTDATSEAQAAILSAEFDDLTGAELYSSAIAGDTSVSTKIAVDHAVGAAYVRAKLYDKAIAPLTTAAGLLADCHEGVGVHLLLADCYHALGKPVDEAAQLAAIRDMHAASRDEKKQAEKRQRDLPASTK